MQISWIILKHKLLNHIDKIDLLDWKPLNRWAADMAFHFREFKRYHLKE